MALAQCNIPCPRCNSIRWYYITDLLTYQCADCKYRITLEEIYDMAYKRRWNYNSRSNTCGSAKITWSPTEGVYVFSCQPNFLNPATKLFFDILKNSIPSSDRTYDPITHEWRFLDIHFDKVKMLAEAAPFSPIDVFTKEKAEEYTRGTTGSKPKISIDQYENRFNEIIKDINLQPADFNTVDFNTVNKVYRRACMLLHPDRNPQGAELMSKLNEAWAAIKEEKFGQKPMALEGA